MSYIIRLLLICVVIINWCLVLASVILVVCICWQLCDINCTGGESYSVHCAGKQHCKVSHLLCDFVHTLTVQYSELYFQMSVVYF